VSTVFSLDVKAAYDELTEELRLPIPVDDGELMPMLSAVDTRRVQARRLHQKAVVAAKERKALDEEKLEAMREQASDALNQERAEGKRSKAPTVADIRSRMVSEYGDEVRAIEMRRRELEAAAEVMGELADAWAARGETLRAVARKVRPGGQA
jgi:hypothetical protein